MYIQMKKRILNPKKKLQEIASSSFIKSTKVWHSQSGVPSPTTAWHQSHRSAKARLVQRFFRHGGNPTAVQPLRGPHPLNISLEGIEMDGPKKTMLNQCFFCKRGSRYQVIMHLPTLNFWMGTPGSQHWQPGILTRCKLGS